MRAEGLSCVFGGVKALTGVDLEVRPNEVLGVIGPNGAGKSTLFNALSGVVPRSGGTVKIGAHEVGRETPSEIRGRGLSRTFQNIRLMPEMTVMENLLVAAHREVRANPFAVTLRTGRVRRAEAAAHAEAERMLELVGLAGHEADQALGLSYGDQRRVEIARALMGGPEVLLLDEPCAGMNPAETAALGELIRSIRDRGIAVVLIEHDMSLMMQIADRIVVLDHGVKIAEGSPKEIREDPRVLDAYLGTAA